MTMLKCIYVSYLASCVGADKTTSPSLTCLLKSAKWGTAPPTPTRNTFSTAWQNKTVSNISKHQHQRRCQLKPYPGILIRKYGGENRSLLLFKIVLYIILVENAIITWKVPRSLVVVPPVAIKASLVRPVMGSFVLTTRWSPIWPRV